MMLEMITLLEMISIKTDVNDDDINDDVKDDDEDNVKYYIKNDVKYYDKESKMILS